MLSANALDHRLESHRQRDDLAVITTQSLSTATIASGSVFVTPTGAGSMGAVIARIGFWDCVFGFYFQILGSKNGTPAEKDCMTSYNGTEPCGGSVFWTQKTLLKGSWGLVTKVINKVTILTIMYNPS